MRFKQLSFSWPIAARSFKICTLLSVAIAIGGPLAMVATLAFVRWYWPDSMIRLGGHRLSELAPVIIVSCAIVGLFGLLIAAVKVFPLLKAAAQCQGKLCVRCGYRRTDAGVCPECGDVTSLSECQQVWRGFLRSTPYSRVIARMYGWK